VSDNVQVIVSPQSPVQVVVAQQPPVQVNAMPAVVIVQEGNISAHNASPTSHPDIRAAIASKPEPYTHIQTAMATSWVINHGRFRKPSITLTDSTGSQVFGAVIHHSDMVASAIFSIAISGEAYCI
jgi:hypothetical protein